MQAVIMAAGKGSRLGDVSEGIPKSFIEIESKRLIDYNIDLLNEVGITDIIVVIGYCAEQFEQLFENNTSVHLVYNPFYEFGNVLSSFWFAQEYLHDDFIYMHADTLCDTTIFKKMMESTADICLPVDYKRCDEEAMKVRCIGNRVVEINKIMPCDIADGEFIGIAKINKSTIVALKEICRDEMKKQNLNAFFEVALQKIIDTTQFNIDTVTTDGAFWCEIDFSEDLEVAKRNIIRSNLLAKRR